MPDELFRTVVVRRPAGRRFSVVPLSAAVHVLIIVTAVIVPLLATDVLPKVSIPLVMQMPAMPIVVVPKVPIPPPGRAPVAVEPAPAPGVPLSAPQGITDAGLAIRDPVPEIPSSELGNVAGAVQGNLQLEAPPPPARAAKPTAPVRVSDVQRPRKIRSQPPVYPPLAIAAHVEGVVVIEAVISTTGAVEQARVITSVPLLDEAALAAVRQWVFTPTLLNGVPVPVIMTVNVEFKLR